MFRSDLEGLPQGPSNPASSQVEPDLCLVPRFVLAHQLLAQLPVFLFLTAWGAGLFGGLIHVVLGIGGRSMPTGVPFIACAVVLAILLPLTSLRLTRRAHEATSYIFRAGQLEYDEGFVTLERKTLPLADITRVRLRRGWLQQRFGLGTLIVTTRARSGHPTRHAVRLLDVPEPAQALVEMRAAMRDEEATRLGRVA
jgi:membrane protein YdbS with pleckstrin-like domain